MSKHTTEQSMFGIWCEVSGGVTGYRCAWMKNNGVLGKFATRDEAEKEAHARNEKANGNPYRTADFRYTVRELSD